MLPKTARIAAMLLVVAMIGTVSGASATSSEPFELARHRGQVVVVDFWASWCKPCRQSIPWLNALRERYGQGLRDHRRERRRGTGDADRFLRDVPIEFEVVLRSGRRPREAIRPARACRVPSCSIATESWSQNTSRLPRSEEARNEARSLNLPPNDGRNPHAKMLLLAVAGRHAPRLRTVSECSPGSARCWRATTCSSTPTRSIRVRRSHLLQQGRHQRRTRLRRRRLRVQLTWPTRTHASAPRSPRRPADC